MAWKVVYQDDATRTRVSFDEAARVRLDVDHAETILNPAQATQVGEALTLLGSALAKLKDTK
jgi:hypothetical protein